MDVFFAESALVSSVTMLPRSPRWQGLKTLLLPRRCAASIIRLIIVSAILLAGCDSSDREQFGVDGFWKGQIVGTAVGIQTPESDMRGSTRPRRILLQLSETAGTVSGIFAESSDAIAFRRLESSNSRSVSTHKLTGTREGQRIRMSFSNDAGGAFEVDAVVNEKSIAGTYSATYGSSNPVADATENGRFEIERY